MTNKIQDLSKKIMAGDKLSIARGITIVENNRAGKQELLEEIYKNTGKAHRIGIAGPPGVGKSSITHRLAKSFLDAGKGVGVVAVDPTSPFSGGALLGDRIRMNDLFNEPEIFIRSMASRGSMGGLAMTATEASDILDASGKPIVILETVGIGQTELDVAEACDTVIIALAPESGDGIQALKAGFMEIADIFVVNKADREGADRAVVEIETVMHLRADTTREIPVIKASAQNNTGIDEIISEITNHFNFLNDNELLIPKRLEHLNKRVRTLTNTLIAEQFWNGGKDAEMAKLIDENTKSSPYQIAQKLIEKS